VDPVPGLQNRFPQPNSAAGGGPLPRVRQTGTDGRARPRLLRARPRPDRGGGARARERQRRPHRPQDREGPIREIDLPPFWIDPVAVTNARFAEFVDATGHRTDAESAGWSFVFGAFLPDDFEPTRGIADAPWWRQVFGADWRHPEGPATSMEDRLDHPVVHVSWNDAKAFAAWAGARLPHEAEWEMAARGGLEQARFPWGDELEPGGRHAMNVWQGEFPSRNTAEDGWLGTAPVDAYEPNGHGMLNMSGNVWEWCADRFDRQTRAIRGGSYLCHASYCNRYRVAARSFNTPDSSTGNMGFRIARDA
jgi:formylglycine-generating enzyme